MKHYILVSVEDDNEMVALQAMRSLRKAIHGATVGVSTRVQDVPIRGDRDVSYNGVPQAGTRTLIGSYMNLLKRRA